MLHLDRGCYADPLLPKDMHYEAAPPPSKRQRGALPDLWSRRGTSAEEGTNKEVNKVTNHATRLLNTKVVSTIHLL